MRVLLIYALLLISAICFAQQKYYFTDDTSLFIKVNDKDIRYYLAKNLHYSFKAAEQLRIGTELGCIRIAPNHDVIDIFIVNSITPAIDANFKSTIKSALKRKNVQISELKDTTDFFVQVRYTIGKGLGGNHFDFMVENDKRPNNTSEEIIMALSFPVFDQLKTDAEVFAPVNDLYKSGSYKQCIEHLDELIRRNPFNTDIIFMRANAYLELDKKEKARADYDYLRYFLQSPKYKKLEGRF